MKRRVNLGGDGAKSIRGQLPWQRTTDAMATYAIHRLSVKMLTVLAERERTGSVFER